MNYDRREKIKQLFKEEEVIFLKKLEEMFPEVSSMTLRRDLEYFEHEGMVMKIRGGVKVLNRENIPGEDDYENRAVSNMVAKMQVSKAALNYIETGRSVYIDSGSTMMCLAKLLPNVNLSIITSAPNIAIEVLKNTKSNVNIVGGSINPSSFSISGSQALGFIKTVNIDIAFIATSGLSAGGGFTCGNYTECELKRAVVKKANKVIVLMDSSKAGKSLAFTFANLKDIDVLITNDRPPENLYISALKSNVELIYLNN